MKNITNGAAAPRPSAAERVLLRAWRFFTSLKCGILLLCCIAAVSIYGTTTIAANSSFGDNAIPIARTQVFESRAFVSLLLLFGIQLILSTWHVTTMSFTIWWKRDFRRSPSLYRMGSNPRGEVPVAGGLEAAMAVLRRRFTRVHRDGNAVFAHKGLLSRFGPTIIHAGIIIVITSQVMRVILIWTGSSMTEGRFLAAEGETTAFVFEPLALEQQMTAENMRSVPLPYWIRVLDFDEIKHANSNVPAYFSSLIEVHDPRTNRVIVAQLDMNHSFAHDGLEFHQAGYQAIDDGQFPRHNFEVRNRLIDERIAITDAHPDTRVRVGNEDLFLEVDSVAPGGRWRLYRSAEPLKAVAAGLLSGASEGNFSFAVEEFFPHFVIDPETGMPTQGGTSPVNPAARVTVFENGERSGTTWVFFDPELNAQVPPTNGALGLRLDDVKMPRGASVETIEWNTPGAASFVLSAIDRASGETLGRHAVKLAERSPNIPYRAGFTAPSTVGAEGDFEVRTIGPTQRFMTIFSVVAEPTVPWTNLGVGFIVFGAMLTFVFRYRALYGLWDEEKGALMLALVPRWGQSPVREEFDALVSELSGGAPPPSSPSSNDAPREIDDRDAVRPQVVEV